MAGKSPVTSTDLLRSTVYKVNVSLWLDAGAPSVIQVHSPLRGIYEKAQSLADYARWSYKAR